jgi:hypothetical protein
MAAPAGPAGLVAVLVVELDAAAVPFDGCELELLGVSLTG